MPFLDWVNKNQAKETTREVPYHLLKQESVHGDVTGVKKLENTTGRKDLELRTIESLRAAKFFPLLQEGKAQQFVYEYRATF